RRLGLDNVDIFYSHRPDAATPLEETIGALDTAVRSGRALYAGISSYSAADTARAAQIARDLGTPLLIHQPSYSMVNRWIEDDGLLETTENEGLGVICFSPLAQGLLTDKYLGGVPADSRAGKSTPSFREGFLSEDNLARIRSLNDIAGARGQSLAQMALAWALRDERVSSLVIGASRVEQLEHNVAALDAEPLSEKELSAIDEFAVDSGVDIWGDARRSTAERTELTGRRADRAACRAVTPCAPTSETTGRSPGEQRPCGPRRSRARSRRTLIDRPRPGRRTSGRIRPPRDRSLRARSYRARSQGEPVGRTQTLAGQGRGAGQTAAVHHHRRAARLPRAHAAAALDARPRRGRPGVHQRREDLHRRRRGLCPRR